MTVSASAAMQGLRDGGITLVTGVPDSTLPGIDLAAVHTGLEHVDAVNEGAAMGIAIGHALVTDRPACVYLQNAGLGVAIDAWASMGCPDALGVPMVLVVGWRGHPDVHDPGHHRVHGDLTAPMLVQVGVEVVSLGDDARVFEQVARRATDERRAIAVLVVPGQWKSDLPRPPEVPRPPGAIGRAAAIAAIVDALQPNDRVVVGVGYMGRQLAALRRARGVDADDIAVAGGMGHASSVALGVARAQPHRRVVCIDGDGAFAMHMGASGTIARSAPASFVHVVLDNACHESVGGPPSLLASVDAAAIAGALGYRNVVHAMSLDALADAVRSTAAGPRFVHVRTVVGDPVPPRP